MNKMQEHSTVAHHLDFLLPGASRRRNVPSWPPDVFALVASLLLVSGGYCVASCDWPSARGAAGWTTRVQRIGMNWRASFKSAAPKRVQTLWSTLMKGKSTSLNSLSEDKVLCRNLIELLAIADSASAGAGVPFDPASGDDFFSRVEILLLLSNASSKGATLCDELKDSTARVLPKMLVPQSGLNIRSFSHHLALMMGSEIRPHWSPASVAPEDKFLNLLILPWPLNIVPANFVEVPRATSTMRNLSAGFAFFEYEHQNDANIVRDTMSAVERALGARGRVDAVVFPECALSPAEYGQLSQMLLGMGIALIAGIGGARNSLGTLENYARIDIPFVFHNVSFQQAKHHRWKLSGSQIKDYGLPISQEKQYWEHIPIKDRSLNFVCLRDWLAICVLICEDLARPDPVGDLIRAVGPNLVIALLLDGPQLRSRWGARHATTLADDPGSSVLTLTCRGMTELSGFVRGSTAAVGNIGLWKDVRHSDPVEINIGDDEVALLEIEVDSLNEWTADGRNSFGGSGHPVLRNIVSWKMRSRGEHVHAV
jgi:hypothetical protein